MNSVFQYMVTKEGVAVNLYPTEPVPSPILLALANRPWVFSEPDPTLVPFETSQLGGNIVRVRPLQIPKSDMEVDVTDPKSMENIMAVFQNASDCSVDVTDAKSLENIMAVFQKAKEPILSDSETDTPGAGVPKAASCSGLDIGFLGEAAQQVVNKSSTVAPATSKCKGLYKAVRQARLKQATPTKPSQPAKPTPTW